MIYMTLPFENDTKTIIKRISSRNISANRKRNIFIIITIALASTLLSAITLYGFGITQKTKNLNKKQHRLYIMQFQKKRVRNYTKKERSHGLENFSMHFRKK